MLEREGPREAVGASCEKLRCGSLRLDLTAPKPTPHSVLLGRGMSMALLLLEPKPSLERKVKDRGPGDSDPWAASQGGFPEAGPLPQRQRALPKAPTVSQTSPLM